MASKSEPPGENKPTANASSESKTQATKGNPDVPIASGVSAEPPPVPHYQIACKPEKDFWDKFKDCAEIAGIVLLAVYTFFTILMYCTNRDAANAAQKAADTAHDTLIASNRPWLDMTASVVGPFVFDSAGGHVSILIETTNVGHSPAIRVSMTQEFIQVFGINPDPRQELKKLCQEAAKQSAAAPSPGLTQTIFLRPEREIWNMTLSPDEMSKPVPGSQYRSPYIYPAFIACVAYHASFSKDEFWTGYAWNVARTPKVPNGVELINPKDGNVATNQVRIYPMPFFGAYTE